MWRILILLCCIGWWQSAVAASSWTGPYNNSSNVNAVIEQPSLPFKLEGVVENDYIQPIIHADILITARSAGTSRELVAYKLSTLQQIWRFSLGSSFPRQPVIKRGLVYLGLSTKPELKALDIVTGQQVWSTTIPNEANIRQAPLVTDDHIFVVGSKLHQVSLSGNLNWSKVYDIRADLAADSQYLYFRSHSMKIHALSQLQGEEIWSYPINTTHGTHPIIHGGILYAGTYQKIIALKADMGTKVFEYDAGPGHSTIGSIAVADSKILFSTNFGDVAALNHSGNLLWATRLNSNSFGGNGWLTPFLVAGNQVLAKSGPNDHSLVDVLTGGIVNKELIGTPGSNFVAVSDQRIVMVDKALAQIYSSNNWQQGSWITPEIRQYPVVIVPGILESWPVNGTWRLDPFVGIFRNLYQIFIEAGYKRDETLFEFPYDWHLSNTETSLLLDQKIEEIKQQTGSPRVDIIAHSMGGLVARHYIQSNSYNDDVSRLVTIATPHKGSAKTYPAWEVGDFGDTAIDKLLEKILAYESYKSGYQNRIVDYLHQRITSLGQLLPNADYLIDSNGFRAYKPCSNILYRCNNFLDELEAGESTLRQRVELITIAGQTNQMTTLSKIQVELKDLLLWPFGKPLNYPRSDGYRYGMGDGTVETSSAHLSGGEVKTFDGDHLSVISNSSAWLARRLRGFSTQEITWVAPNRYMLLRVYSPIAISLMDSRTGLAVDSYTYSKEGAAFTVIPEPIDATYDLIINGTGVGNYRIEIGLYGDDFEVEKVIQGEASMHSQEKINIQVDSGTFDILTTERDLPVAATIGGRQISNTSPEPSSTPSLATIPLATSTASHNTAVQAITESQQHTPDSLPRILTSSTASSPQVFGARVDRQPPLVIIDSSDRKGKALPKVVTKLTISLVIAIAFVLSLVYFRLTTHAPSGSLKLTESTLKGHNMTRNLSIIAGVVVVILIAVTVFLVSRYNQSSQNITQTPTASDEMSTGFVNDEPIPAPSPSFEFSSSKKSAHYVSNSPEHGSISAEIPPEVSLRFNFDLAAPSSISIKKDGTEYGVGETKISSDKLTLSRALDPVASSGLYTVTYKACWPDKSCHDGNFQFAVK